MLNVKFSTNSREHPVGTKNVSFSAASMILNVLKVLVVIKSIVINAIVTKLQRNVKEAVQMLNVSKFHNLHWLPAQRRKMYVAPLQPAVRKTMLSNVNASMVEDIPTVYHPILHAIMDCVKI